MAELFLQYQEFPAPVIKVMQEIEGANVTLGTFMIDGKKAASKVANDIATGKYSIQEYYEHKAGITYHKKVRE